MAQSSLSIIEQDWLARLKIARKTLRAKLAGSCEFFTPAENEAIADCAKLMFAPARMWPLAGWTVEEKRQVRKWAGTAGYLKIQQEQK